MAARRSRTATRAAAVLVAVAIAVVAVASAAQVVVRASDRELSNVAPCTTLTLPTTYSGTMTTGNYTQVRIASIPAACNNLAISVVVYGALGVQLATGTGNTGATGTATITTTSYRGVLAKGVALLVNTWGVRTTWTAPPYYTCVALDGSNRLVAPTVNCTLTNVSVTLGTHGVPPLQTATMSFQVANLGGNPRFLVTIDFAANPPFPGWTPVDLWQRFLRNDPAFACTQLPFVSQRGRVNQGPTYYFYETLDPVNFNPGGYTQICNG